MSQSVSVDGRDGFEHRVISGESVEDIQSKVNQLLETSPANWSDEDMKVWENVCCEVERQAESSRVFEIGDEAVLVGVEMTATNGAVSYRDEYNKNEIPVIVTGYNASEDIWEVMITEDTLSEIIMDSYLSDGDWRDMFLEERPANGGVTGYVIAQKSRGVLSESRSYRKRGVYKP